MPYIETSYGVVIYVGSCRCYLDSLNESAGGKPPTWQGYFNVKARGHMTVRLEVLYISSW